ncbi:expressed unknown protein [Seminavis robusta]|uniref:Uncharacterized protein n=1 Tax=Seminavis robusta TaxID=568900 RepID=A0A9N8E4N8_9STRA|nr:expressed unknown protein [Seminavis robusta]|eukprot:Sro497_g154790.1 n/a (435) ;mRNA; r:33865-35169
MKPRDISQSQLWFEDGSVSSIGSFLDDSDSDDDDKSFCSNSGSEEEEEDLMANRALEDSLHCLNTLVARTQSNARRGSKTKSLSPTRPSLGHRPLAMSRTKHSRRLGSAPSSTNALPLLNSPMRKFQSNTSDSNLSASRSCHLTRRRVSQANAKWDATCSLNKKRPALQIGSLYGSRRLNINQLMVPEEAITASTAGSVGSRETRWSASSHTQSSIVRCPRRQNSQDSLYSGSGASCEGSTGPKRRGRRPNKQDEAATATETTATTKAETEQEETKARSLSPMFAPTRVRPQIPHRQKSFKRQSAAVSMDNVIKDAMAAAELCEPIVRDAPVLAHSPMSAPLPSSSSPQQSQKSPDSLVSLMSPFRSLSPPRHRAGGMTKSHTATTALDTFGRIDKLKKKKKKSKKEKNDRLANCSSMSDLTMKKPKRRGSMLA